MSGIAETLCTLLLANLPETPLHAGRVHGGWGYIWTSYGLAWAALLGYAVYVLRLRRRLKALPPENPPSSPPPP